MFEELAVGKVHGKLKGVPEGIRISISESGIGATITFTNPTDEEIEEIKKGDIKIKLCMLKGIVFVLIKFGTLEWMDMPYNVHLASDINPLKKIDCKDVGYAMNIIFADNITGIIKVLRFISLSEKNSKDLYKLIEEQRMNNFTVAEYEKNLNDVYNNYTTKDLLKISI